MNEDQEYLDTVTVARMCRVPERTVRDWCRSGKIPGAEQDRYNGHWRIPLSAVVALLEERKQQARELLAALGEGG